MPRRTLSLVLILVALLSYSATQVSSALRAEDARSTAAREYSAEPKSESVPTPADVLGFTPGDDRRLASWAQTVESYQRLAASSPRVKFEELGKSTMGAPFVLATISAPENLARLEEYRDIQRQLADPRTLGANPD